jgi:hypothetical protein
MALVVTDVTFRHIGAFKQQFFAKTELSTPLDKGLTKQTNYCQQSKGSKDNRYTAVTAAGLHRPYVQNRLLTSTLSRAKKGTATLLWHDSLAVPSPTRRRSCGQSERLLCTFCNSKT